jgi:hypothetical protein
MRRLLPVLPLLAIALAACDGDDAVDGCPPVPDLLPTGASTPREVRLPAPYAVAVEVVDSLSGENLAAGATGAWVTGSTADSLRHDLPQLLTAYGPAGRYSLIVQYPGYYLWGVNDVVVRETECGFLEEARVTARLQRAERRD